MGERDTAYRQGKIDLSGFDYPFMFIRNRYGGYVLSEINTRLITETEILSCENFPDNIRHIFWAHPGVHDEYPWLLLVLLNNNFFAYYSANCDYSGFDCRGSMNLHVSGKYANLINFAMTDEEYRMYISETTCHPDLIRVQTLIERRPDLKDLDDLIFSKLIGLEL